MPPVPIAEGGSGGLCTGDTEMPKNKDLKRLIRARMEKTGESYTAARLHLLADTLPLPADYERVAGMSDDAVTRATGKGWPEWARVLDAADASLWDHRTIAKWLHSNFDDVSHWWAQSVTVAYERFRGLREVGQRREGGFDVNRSRTLDAPIQAVYRAVFEGAERQRWLPDLALDITTATTDRSIRARLEDGTRLDVYFTAKPNDRCSVQFQHRKLPDREQADAMRAFWGDRLDALKGQVTEK